MSADPDLSAPDALAGELETGVARSPGLVVRVARRLVLQRLASLAEGELELIDPGAGEGQEQRLRFGARTSACPLHATLRVQDPHFYAAVALGGALGAAEAYVEGLWHSDDLVAVVRVMARNRQVLGDLERGLARLVVPLRKLAHALRRNSRAGSRRNIAAHYDLGNDFYRQFLDPTMMYSCALFDGLDEDAPGALQAASLAKLDLVCRKLELKPGDEVVEIGTGWGGFALHAARGYGCRVTTTTISRQQFKYAREQVHRLGLEDRVEVLLEDYRDLTGPRFQGRFDKLVSLEMIEAVGYRYLDGYFATCSGLLKPQGMGLIQAITLADQEFERYRRNVDFIQRYIFPGAQLLSLSAITRCLARSTDLTLFHLHDITPHYASTLRLWRRSFLEHAAEIRALGFSESFLRLWEYYFCYCEGGFEERVIGDVQLLLTKPLCRRAPVPVAAA